MKARMLHGKISTKKKTKQNMVDQDHGEDRVPVNHRDQILVFSFYS